MSPGHPAHPHGCHTAGCCTLGALTTEGEHAHADLAALTAAVEAGNRAEAVSLTQAAIDEGIEPNTVLDAMTEAMTEVGRKFACNEGVYVPEMLISAHAMKEASAVLEPLLAASGALGS